MPAKNKRNPVIGYDLQNDFAAHMEASVTAHDWVAKCLALRQAGKAAQAKAAENKAKQWLRLMILIETVSKAGKSVAGRSVRS